VTGEVEFGPVVRASDGGRRQYGAAPGRGARVTARRYRTGGGRHGNVGRGRIRVLKTSVPYVSSVENRQATTGGADGETAEEAKVRGPLELRASGRAVTADDFEELARAAAPEVARVRCVPASRGDAGVRLLVVPYVPADSAGRLPYDELASPRADLLSALADHLDRRRLVGTRLLVAPPVYQGVTVVARVVASAADERTRGDVQAAAVRAVHRHLSPLDGGPDGTGWPFGRPVHDYEVSAVLSRVPGVELVEEVILFPAAPQTGRRGEPQGRIVVPDHGLAYSYQPQIRVQ
jgi:predicted phage baseplate assembly protein